MNSIKRIKRHLYFYDLTFPNVATTQVRDTVRQVFNEINRLNKTKAGNRFDPVGPGEKNCMRDIRFFSDNNNLIKGKIIRLREDAFPQVFHEQTDALTDIDVNEDDSIAETTHFIVDIRKSSIVLVIEGNFYGPKFMDVASYITMIMLRLSLGDGCIPIPKVKDDLSSYLRRINRVAEFIVSVHKDEVKRIAGFDKGLFEACSAAKDFGKAEFVVLNLKFEWEKATVTPFTVTAKNMVSKMINSAKYHDIFNKLIVRAEDADRHNTIQAFDLLSDKLKSQVMVQRKDKIKVIISEDMFEKLEVELRRHVK